MGEIAELWNDFILCCEMTIFAMVHLYSFPWWEFRTGMPSSRDLVAQNAKKVLSFKDVVSDVYHNIAPAYQTYVLQTDDGVKEYKTKTYMIGNLNDAKSQSNKQKKGKTKKFKKKGKYILHTDDNEYDIDSTETENDSDDYNSDDYDDDMKRKTPDSLTNLIGNDSNDKIDMTPIDIEHIHNAESDDDSDPHIT